MLKIIALIATLCALQGCAALWVADTAADTAWFATKTTAKAGTAAAELTWDAGTAVAGAASEDEGEDGQKEKSRHGESSGD